MSIIFGGLCSIAGLWMLCTYVGLTPTERPAELLIGGIVFMAIGTLIGALQENKIAKAEKNEERGRAQR